MKKVIGLIVLAIAACVATVALMETRPVDAGGPQIDTYKCYQARHAKRTPRFQSERVFITDQFRHNVEVQVLKLNTHCAAADQELYSDDSGTSAGFGPGLDCYSIRDVPRQERFRSQNIEVRDKLTNWGVQRLTISKLSSLCTITMKNQIFKGTLENSSFVCYQAKTAKGQPRFQQRDMLINDQYSGKEVRVIRPVAYCSEGEKKQAALNDDFENEFFLEEGNLQYGVRFENHASTVHAELENNDPIISCKTDYSHSVWYHWDAQQNSSMMVSTEGTTYDTVVAVFTGDKGDLDEVTCNDDVDLCDMSLFATGAASGGCRNFCIDGQAAGCFCPVGSETAGGCCEAGNTAGGSCCPVMIITGGSGNESECTEPWSFAQFDAWQGTTYHILVASSEDRGGKLKFELLRKDDPSNVDSCQTPFSIPQLNGIGAEQNVHISTMNASVPTSSGAETAGVACISNQDPDPSCAGTFGASVWFNYTPPAHQIVNIDTSDSSYPTVITVYNANGPTELACGNGFTTVQLEENTGYLIMVASTDDNNLYRGGKLKFKMTVKDQLGGDFFSAGVGPQAPQLWDSLTCYQVRQARHSNETDHFLDQFALRQVQGKGPGFWTLIVGAVDTVCVPSNKDTCTGNNFLTGVGEAAELCGNEP